ncbi:MAG: flagellar motor protein MotB [Terracidiphilus sp.]|jgi:chemotaxis protein MotB
MGSDDQIIIVRKKSGHAGHHGGAWKVAYADFVTAMMSLFIVLWLMNSSKPIQTAVGGYFRDPNGTAQKTGTTLGGAGDAAAVKKEDMSKLKDDLMKSMAKMKDFEKLKKLIEMTVTPEGLQIELMEDPQGTFFEMGSAEPTPVLKNVLTILAPEVAKLPNLMLIEGHTDSKPYPGTSAYGNWELSSDRANTARRLMESKGVQPTQVAQVRGYADRKLRKPKQPEDASNRRITVIIQYLVNPADQAVAVSKGTLPPIK